jgi:hypothetical protein
MGLLAKTNRTATRESVIRWATGGAIFAPVWTFLLLRLTLIPHILIAMAVVGAGIGALVEWQLDDGEEGDKVTQGIPPSGVWDRELDHEYSQVRRGP